MLYAIFAEHSDTGYLLPLGAVDGDEGEREATTFRRFFETADELVASLCDRQARRYDGHPLIRRAEEAPLTYRKEPS